MDVIGLSGITPGLDEMVYIASELERQSLDFPLPTGSATTSEAYAAVKIDLKYKNAVVHVHDASRAINTFDWENEEIFTPNNLGIKKVGNQDLNELVPFIDWSSFFRSWDLYGKYPNILEDEVWVSRLKNYFKDAQITLKRILDEKLLTIALQSSEKIDYMGAFCVTTGFGTDEFSGSKKMAVTKFSRLKLT